MSKDLWIDRKLYEWYYDHKKEQYKLGMTEKEYLRFLKQHYGDQYKVYKEFLKTSRSKRVPKEDVERMNLPEWYTPRFFK